ncbi:hypothetical protein niasHT_008241 [Heterodera trifolii]|uniref:Uncharacterized protein n=1 Tax=Heterodera trifolii TaxID=157864 RepID=A0ABD2LUN9_9BILA
MTRRTAERNAAITAGSTTTNCLFVVSAAAEPWRLGTADGWWSEWRWCQRWPCDHFCNTPGALNTQLLTEANITLLLGDENMLRLRVDEAQQCFTRPRGRRRRSRMNEIWRDYPFTVRIEPEHGLNFGTNDQIASRLVLKMIKNRTSPSKTSWVSAPPANFPLSSFQSPGLNPPHPNSRESTHQHFNHRDSTHHNPITNLNILDITEFVHKNNVKNSEDSCWLQNLRIYFNSNERDPLKSCFIKMDKAEFFYGLEYLGIQEKLVQTPLTDRWYLTMTDALHCRRGVNPFGPAETGKTAKLELGDVLMSSIVSRNETVNADSDMKVDLVGKNLTVNSNMAIFITMNSGYSGRSNLLDNLKQLFRSLAMTSPNRWPIAEVMLFSQGFQSAEILANKIALLFTLKNKVLNICKTKRLSCSPIIGEKGNLWLEKVLQVYQITNINHGLMLVGASGSGKTTAWKTLLEALENYERVESVSHVIDAKSISKDTLYGTLDPNTREWTDGLFTHIIQKIIDNVRGELDKRQWIIFDGDVRIIFEVADLKFATMATVSRCGMVWFSEDVGTPEMLREKKTLRLKKTR